MIADKMFYIGHIKECTPKPIIKKTMLSSVQHEVLHPVVRVAHVELNVWSSVWRYDFVDE